MTDTLEVGQLFSDCMLRADGSHVCINPTALKEKLHRIRVVWTDPRYLGIAYCKRWRLSYHMRQISKSSLKRLRITPH